MKLWPVAECLHEFKQDQQVVMNFVGEIVRIFPAFCPECHYRWPADISEVQQDGHDIV